MVDDLELDRQEFDDQGLVAQEREEIVQTYVRLYVAGGFYTSDQIVELLQDAVFEPGTVDPDRLAARVEAEMQRKRAEERTWPEETDCDRLTRAFAALDRQGIIALHNAGYTLADGLADVTQFYDSVGGPRSHYTGFCFYHEQDVERAVDGLGLSLAFGDLQADPSRALEVGRLVLRALTERGFVVQWDGTVEMRLEVPALRWQKRSAR